MKTKSLKNLSVKYKFQGVDRPKFEFVVMLVATSGIMSFCGLAFSGIMPFCDLAFSGIMPFCDLKTQ